MSKQMFSESWHRVAAYRAWLRSNVSTQKQIFQGSPWYVLRDPFSNKFFRLSEEAYRFVARLSPRKTIEQVWRESLLVEPDDAPGQEEVIQLLSQLTQANLISSDLPPDSEMLFERHQKTRRRERLGALANFLFFQIRLFDPHALFTGLTFILRPLLGWVGAIIWLGVVFAGLKSVIENWEEATHQAQGLLAPQNLMWLYICSFVIKAWHETGHGVLCRRFGGEVRSCGVMLLVLTPMPFVDVTASWGFRRNWQRALVASGGMIFELFLAGIAALIWSATGQGLLNSLAYNAMILSSVTTMAFNANPLLRFDGYYIFSDLIGVPNLSSRATTQLRYLAERYLFGYMQATSQAANWRESTWLALYGVASATYRILLIGVIIMVIAQHFFGVGIALAVFCGAMWVGSPVWKFLRYIFTDPHLERTRGRAIRVTFLLVAAIVGFLVFYPLPRHFRADGVIESESSSDIYAPADGFVQKVAVLSGSHVTKGQVLVQLHSPELDLRIDAAQAQLRQIQFRRRMADTEAQVVIQSVLAEQKAAEKLLTTLLDEQKSLTITAPHDGIWVSREDRTFSGLWMDRGTQLGELFDPTAFRFTAVVPQQEASNLFQSDIKDAEVRLKGLQVGHVIRGTSERVVPGKQEILPSAALGWRAGGPIEVMGDNPDGLHAVEPFFKVSVSLDRHDDVFLAQRATGVARFTIPPEPLFFQALRSVRQLVQKRLKI